MLYIVRRYTLTDTLTVSSCWCCDKIEDLKMMPFYLVRHPDVEAVGSGPRIRPHSPQHGVGMDSLCERYLVKVECQNRKGSNIENFENYAYSVVGKQVRQEIRLIKVLATARLNSMLH